MFSIIPKRLRSHMNGLLLFEETTEQTTGATPLAPKTIATYTLENQWNYKHTILYTTASV